MKAGVMTAGVFWRARSATEKVDRERESPTEESVRPFVGWSPERFANEQLRGLARRVFSPSATPQVRQVVFSALDPETDVGDLCLRVGEMLAEETLGDVAIVSGQLRARPETEEFRAEPPEISHDARTLRPREIGTRVQGNLWSIPLVSGGRQGSSLSLHKYLGEIRREFEYSIVAAASCGGSPEAISTAQFADGIILVLSALYTRRIAALRIRDAMESAQIRLLGTVLKDREFPIPAGLYRRL